MWISRLCQLIFSRLSLLKASRGCRRGKMFSDLPKERILFFRRDCVLIWGAFWSWTTVTARLRRLHQEENPVCFDGDNVCDVTHMSFNAGYLKESWPPDVKSRHHVSGVISWQSSVTQNWNSTTAHCHLYWELNLIQYFNPLEYYQIHF